MDKKHVINKISVVVVSFPISLAS